MKCKINSVKGTRDFYPEQMRVRNWLYQKMRKVSEAFGYEEYEGPFLETIDLYAAKSGDELVKEQAFTFQDRGGDWITLRPELTPTLARMVAQKQSQLVFPLKWWSFGPMWRYERPQKGRSREFFQWNIDLIGAETPAVDAELVAIGAMFLQEVGLKPDQVQILVNNRRLMDDELAKLNIKPEEKSSIYRLIDRKDKMKLDDWREYAKEVGLNNSQLQSLELMLQNQELWKKSEELTCFFQTIEAYGFSEYVRFSPEIIRGLDYYTGTVFEARDKDGEFRAILGGGRYDNLVEDVGGDRLSGVGFAMGDVVVSLVLQKYDCLPKARTLTELPIFISVFNQEMLLRLLLCQWNYGQLALK
jgi:histidyl-tRNA synthetase